jgi:hypothetical protein
MSREIFLSCLAYKIPYTYADFNEILVILSTHCGQLLVRVLMSEVLCIVQKRRNTFKMSHEFFLKKLSREISVRVISLYTGLEPIIYII